MPGVRERWVAGETNLHEALARPGNFLLRRVTFSTNARVYQG